MSAMDEKTPDVQQVASAPDSPQRPALDRRRLLQAAAASSLVAGVVGARGVTNEAAAVPPILDLPQRRWTIWSDGQRGELVINSVDNQGRVAGVAFGQPIRGYWSKPAQKLIFVYLSRTNRWYDTATYTGYLFPLPTQDVVAWALAGSFQQLSTTHRNEFGWYAIISEPG